MSNEVDNDYWTRLRAASIENLDESLELKVKNNLDSYFTYKKAFTIVISITIIFYLCVISCQFIFGDYTQIKSLKVLFPTIESICKGSIEVQPNCQNNCSIPFYNEMQKSAIFVEAFWHMLIVVLMIVYFIYFIKETKKVATHEKTRIGGHKYEVTTYIKDTEKVIDRRIEDNTYTYKTYQFETRKATMIDKLSSIRFLIFFGFLMVPFQFIMDGQYNIEEYKIIFDIFYFYSYENCFEDKSYSDKFRELYDSNIDSFNLWFYYRHGVKVVSGILVTIALVLSIKFFGIKKLILCRSNIKEVSVEEAAKFSEGIKY